MDGKAHSHNFGINAFEIMLSYVKSPVSWSYLMEEY